MNEEMNRLSCEVVRDLLPLYHDKVVSEVTQQAVAEHLAVCSDCSAEYETLRTELPDKKDSDIKKRFSVAIKRVRHKGLIKGIAIAAAAVAVLVGTWYFLTEVPIRSVPQEDINIIRAYRYDYSSDEVLNYETGSGEGIFIYYEVPEKYFSGPTTISSEITDDGEFSLNMKTAIITWNRTNDDPEKTYKEILEFPFGSEEKPSRITFNGKEISNSSEEVPEYVREYLLFSYVGGDEWVTDTTHDTMSAYRFDGTMTTWDLDGNVIRESAENDAIPIFPGDDTPLLDPNEDIIRNVTDTASTDQ